MVRRVMRAAVFAGLTLALWVLARPAQAMPAGLCDDRGASAIAPPPTLETPETALQRARRPVTCLGDGAPGQATVAPAHHAHSTTAFDAEPALASARVVACAAAPGRELKVADGTQLPLAGARIRVERPPRG